MTDDSLSKISRGLDARKRAAEGLDKAPLRVLVNAPRTSAALMDLLSKGEAKAVNMREFVTGQRNRIAEFEAKKTAEIAKISNLSKEQRRDIVRVAVTEERKRLREAEPALAAFFKQFERQLAEIGDTYRLARAVKADWQSSIGALMRATLGSEKRRAFAADVATAGPHELDGYLREAVKIGGETGEALAAAVFSRLDELAERAPDVRNRVTVDKGEVADLLIGSRCIAARQAIEAIEILHDQLALEAKELAGAEVSQASRDALRVKKHNFDAQFPKEQPEPNAA